MNPLTSFSETLLAEFNEAGVGPVALTYDPSREVKVNYTPMPHPASHRRAVDSVEREQMSLTIGL